MTISNEAKTDIKQWVRDCGDRLPSHHKAELNKILEKHGGPSTVTAAQVDDARDGIEFRHDDNEVKSTDPED